MAQRTTTQTIKTSEKQAQAAICEYLAIRMRQKKLMFWRNNNVPVFDTGFQGFRKLPEHTLKGSPDIIVVHNGSFIGLEVKGSGKKLSADQLDFQKLVKEVGGGEYYRVTSIDDLKVLGL
jgi:hypothetical protein